MTMPRKLFRLRKLDFDEVSVVPSGDDPEADIVLSKADKTHKEQEVRHTMASMNEGGNVPDEISKDDLPPEVVEYIDTLEAQIETDGELLEAAASVFDELEAEFDEMDTEDGAEDEVEDEELELVKSDPAVREAIEKAESAAAEAIAKAEAATEELARRDYISKAQNFTMLSTDSVRFGEILKAIDDYMPDEEADELADILSKAQAALAEGNLFEEIGSNVAKTAPKLDAAVEEIRKSDPNLTYEGAVEVALTNNPSLYDEES